MSDHIESNSFIHFNQTLTIIFYFHGKSALFTFFVEHDCRVGQFDLIEFFSELGILYSDSRVEIIPAHS